MPFREACAVFGTVSSEVPASLLTYFGLYALQHRGQDASGIASSDGNPRLHLHKGLGLVSQVHDEKSLGTLVGEKAIGHNRYSTSESNEDRFAQPSMEGDGTLAFGFNGNIPDTTLMCQFLSEIGKSPVGKNDTQLMSTILWHFLEKTGDLSKALKECWSLWNGAFSAVVLWNDTLAAVRGHYGVRPLVLGKRSDGYVVASESCCFDAVDARYMRDVKPGEVVFLEREYVRSVQIAHSPLKFDVFELVYFMRPDSIFNDESVYAIRERMGFQLGKELLQSGSRLPFDAVYPVPDSAIPAALGFMRATDIPVSFALTKNRYIHRTFIAPTQEQRELAQRHKLNLITDQVTGKRALILDDSIVRGTTAIPLVKRFRRAGAREVHFGSASPPVMYPNFYGIATPTQLELIAAQMSVSQMAAHFGADSVQYLSYQGLLDVLGVPESKLDTSCFTGNYPIDIGKHIHEIHPK